MIYWPHIRTFHGIDRDAIRSLFGLPGDYTVLSGEGFGSRDLGRFDSPPQQEVYSRSFGKYLAQEGKDSKFSGEEKERRERARRANRIYRQVCVDAGLKSCFFSNFGTWSDFVAGKMSEAEFHDQTLHDAEQMVLAEEGNN